MGLLCAEKKVTDAHTIFWFPKSEFTFEYLESPVKLTNCRRGEGGVRRLRWTSRWLHFPNWLFKKKIHHKKKDCRAGFQFPSQNSPRASSLGVFGCGGKPRNWFWKFRERWQRRNGHARVLLGRCQWFGSGWNIIETLNSFPPCRLSIPFDWVPKLRLPNVCFKDN